MPFQIQRPDIWAALQRLFRITDKGSLRLESSVIGMVKIADVSQSQVPGVFQHVTAQCQIVPAAGEFANFRLEAPTGMLCVLDRLTIQAVATAGIIVAHVGSTLSAAIFASAADKSFTDGRLVQQGRLPGGVLGFGSSGGVPAANEFRRPLQANVPTEVLFRGWAAGSGLPELFGFIEFGFNTADVTLNIDLEWDEFSPV